MNNEKILLIGAQDLVSGVVVVANKGKLSHSGITLLMEGSVQLQLSAKSIGLFEAFYNSIKPVQLLYYSVTIAESGELYPNIKYMYNKKIVINFLFLIIIIFLCLPAIFTHLLVPLLLCHHHVLCVFLNYITIPGSAVFIYSILTIMTFSTSYSNSTGNNSDFI
jgi:hypothetical protein